MTIITPIRTTALVNDEGDTTLRFAEFLDEIVESVNRLVARPINTQNSSYTFLLTDALMIVRKTSTTANQVYTIPANTSVAFELGHVLEVQNDGSVAMTVAIDTDTLTSEAGLGTGTRTIGPGGSGRFVKVADTEWKARGEQMT